MSNQLPISLIHLPPQALFISLLLRIANAVRGAFFRLKSHIQQIGNGPGYTLEALAVHIDGVVGHRSYTAVAEVLPNGRDRNGLAQRAVSHDRGDDHRWTLCTGKSGWEPCLRHQG